MEENMYHSKELQRLTITSIFTALAVVFGMMTKFIPGLNLQMPQGGAVFGFSMLPIVLIGILAGPKYGFIGGAMYGLASVLLDGGFYHWASLFSDYVIAFGIIGITGFFRKGIDKPLTFALAVLLAGFLRYLSHSLGGAIIFAEFAPEGMNPWYYSFIIYNLPYMASSTAVTLVLGLLTRPLIKQLATDYKLIDRSKEDTF